jgi:hypothetical protein
MIFLFYNRLSITYLLSSFLEISHYFHGSGPEQFPDADIRKVFQGHFFCF